MTATQPTGRSAFQLTDDEPLFSFSACARLPAGRLEDMARTLIDLQAMRLVRPHAADETAAA